MDSPIIKVFPGQICLREAGLFWTSAEGEVHQILRSDISEVLIQPDNQMLLLVNNRRQTQLYSVQGDILWQTFHPKRIEVLVTDGQGRNLAILETGEVQLLDSAGLVQKRIVQLTSPLSPGFYPEAEITDDRINLTFVGSFSSYTLDGIAIN